MRTNPCTARIHFTVPPGESLVGFMPFTMFRIDQVKTSVDPLLHLGTPRGQYVTFDGSVHDVRSDSGRTLCLGNFVAFHVKNDSSFPRAADITITGPAVDWPPDTLVQGKVILGAFAQEVEKEPEPFEPSDLGLDLVQVIAQLEARDPTTVPRLLALFGMTREELDEALKTPEGRAAITQHLAATPLPD